MSDANEFEPTLVTRLKTKFEEYKNAMNKGDVKDQIVAHKEAVVVGIIGIVAVAITNRTSHHRDDFRVVAVYNDRSMILKSNNERKFRAPKHY